MINTYTTAKENNLTETELAAILLYYYTKKASFSWMTTVGINNLSSNKNILAAQWFKTERIQNAIHFIYKEIEKDEKRFDEEIEQPKPVEKVNLDQDIEITSENIKQILQSEFQSIKDPDKRAVILMKIADFVGLKNSDQDDPLTPTIYLPARCSQCKQLKSNSI